MLGPVAAADTGEVYVSDARASVVQTSSIHVFSPTGADNGAFTASGGGSGIFPPTFLGTDALGNILYSTYTSAVGGNVMAQAVKRPPGGVGNKTVSASFNDGLSSYKLYFGAQGGDSAGNWLVGVQIQNGAFCTGTCGYDFGKGVETGDRVLRYDAAGTYLGSIPSPGTWRLAADGGLYVVTGFQGTTDVGCGPITSGTGQSTALARRDQAGACVWSKAFAAPAPAAFTIGADGTLLFAIFHTGSIDLGTGPTPDLGGQNLTIARLDGAGAVLSTFTLGGPTAAFTGATIDAVPSGIIVLQSGFSGAVDLGGGPLPATGNTLIAAFDPTGTLRWSKVVQAGGFVANVYPTALRMTRQPCNLVVATDSPTVDLGAGPVVPVPAMGPPDIAVIGLAL